MSLPRLLALYWRLRRGTHWSPERLRRHQEERLRALVAHAAASVPFYRQRFVELGLRPGDIRTLEDLRHLPVVTKAELQAAGEEARLSSVFARDVLEGGRTSGSSGRPFMIFRDPHFARLRKAAFVRALAAGPYRFGRKVLVISGLPKRQQPAWMRWHQVSSEEEPERLLRLIQELRPDILYGFLTPLRQVAEHAKAVGVAPHRPLAVYTTAETLDGHSRALLAATFGPEIHDIYGTTEAGVIGWECAAHAGYHLAEDTTIVELLEGGAGGAGRLVTTCLEQYAMPLLRYEVGDLALPMDAGPCPCGCRFSRIARIEGRLVDCVRLPGGRSLSPYHLTLAIEDTPGLERYQIIQRSAEGFLVRAQGAGPSADAAIQAGLRAVLGERARIDVEWCADLEPPPGRKFRVVECRIGSQEAACVS
ncbi:phenylacetate--CoA ligase family protein [Marinimicrococcus flavescens]|uniref:Phenylacetate--CoA ligase family protein n=1 Tax=Marinimicrococcus flavescens TaxID=3031815 RepID=A0AAP3V0D4_9PROT|nr:hypothetical protein [Marinimicrococcus flavescens]